MALWKAAEKFKSGGFKTHARCLINFAFMDLIKALERGDEKREKDAAIAMRERGGK